MGVAAHGQLHEIPPEVHTLVPFKQVVRHHDVSALPSWQSEQGVRTLGLSQERGEQVVRLLNGNIQTCTNICGQSHRRIEAAGYLLTAASDDQANTGKIVSARGQPGALRGCGRWKVWKAWKAWKMEAQAVQASTRRPREG